MIEVVLKLLVIELENCLAKYQLEFKAPDSEKLQSMHIDYFFFDKQNNPLLRSANQYIIKIIRIWKLKITTKPLPLVLRQKTS